MQDVEQPIYCAAMATIWRGRTCKRVALPTMSSLMAIGTCWLLQTDRVPLLVKGGIDCWIRTDGNDTLGDGTSNDPQHAFKTIAGCWAAVGSRYASTPLTIDQHEVRSPGTYDGTIIGPFGGSVSLSGDPNNPAAYRIANFYAHPLMYPSLWVQAIAGMNINGVTFLCNTAAPDSRSALRCVSANVAHDQLPLGSVDSEDQMDCCIDQHGGKWSTSKGVNTWIGNGLQIGFDLVLLRSGTDRRVPISKSW